MRYILYARKSSEEKTRQIQSIDDQITALTPLVAERGYTVVDTLTESRSAKAPGRPVFGQMIDMINRGEVDAILCWHLNRLSRNEIDSGTIRWLLRQGIIKEIVTPHRTYVPEDNALITAVESAMGEQFIVELTQNTRRGVLSKVEKGWFPGRVPQGYKSDVFAHTIGRDPDRWGLVQRAWNEMAGGRVSVPELARKMTAEWGYVAPSGNPGMPRTTLYNIFSNPFYTGVFVWEGQMKEGQHEAMVSHALFADVQRLLGKQAPGARRNRRFFAYGGLLRCGHCGNAVSPDRKRKVIKATGEERFYTYYACARGSRCPYEGRIREDQLEKLILGLLNSITLPEQYLEYARERIREWEATEEKARREVRSSRERSMANSNQQAEELLTLRLRNLITDDEFAARKVQLNQARDTQMMAARQENEAEERSLLTLGTLSEFCVEGQRKYLASSVADRGHIARQLGTSFLLRGGTIAVEEHGLLALVREHKEKTASTAAILEPAKSGSGTSFSYHSAHIRSGWGELLDAIRRKACEEGLVFPGGGAP